MRNRPVCCAGRGYAPMATMHIRSARCSAMPRSMDRPPRTQGTRGYSGGYSGVLMLIDGSTAAYGMHLQAPMLRPVLAAGRSRPIQPYLSVLLVGRYGRSMRIIDTIAITPTTRHRPLPVSEYRGNMALQATHPTGRCCRCLVESAGTQQLCRCPPAHTCTLHVRARIHETDQTIRGTRAARRCARAQAS
jgi:hypothetical protein